MAITKTAKTKVAKTKVAPKKKAAKTKKAAKKRVTGKGARGHRRSGKNGAVASSVGDAALDDDAALHDENGEPLYLDDGTHIEDGEPQDFR